MVKFIADSSCDIFEYTGENFESVPLLLYTDENEFFDDGSIDIDNMLTTMENHKGRSHTACPGTERWLNAFEGADEIYVVTITSGLSGTYNSALVAKEMYLQEHPDAKIEVFDSLSTGPEMLMGIEKAVELKKQGLSFEEVCEKLHKYFEDVHLLFVLQSIHNLAENGRVSKVIAQAVGVLGISIIGIASEEGKIKQVGKARGDKRVIKHMMELFEEVGFNGGKVRMCEVQNPKLCEALKTAILEKYPSADIKFYPAGGLCSYYAERGGIIVGFECK